MSSTTPQQGIVSILGSDHDRAASLRRTLSADMSSKKWLTQNGFSNPPMKRIASSEELNEKYDNNSSHKEGKAPSQDDIWSLIVSKKAKEEENSTLPPPYIHPLVRRSTSSLCEKSLELCTESLGSETGSEKFSSNSPSETGDAEEDEIVLVHLQPQQVAKFNISSSKKSSSPPPKSFPPPLPSLAPKDGPSLQMQPHREDGRLVLEAVAIPSQNCFSAHRENGRLRLTFAKTSLTQELDKDDDDDDDVEEKVLDYFEEEKEEEEETDEEDENEEEVVEKFELENYDKEHGIVINQGQDYSSRVIYVHRSALVMKNLMGLSNRDPKLSEKLKKKVDLVEMEMEMENYTTLSQSLPRPTRMAKITTSPPIAASFNAYEYFWTSKPITQEKSPLNNYTQNVISPKINRNKEMELLRGNKGDYLVSLVGGCNENYKKSLLFWEPYCIATS